MHWKPVVFLGGLLSQLVTAQQYAGDVIPNSLPSVPGSEIAYFKIKEPTGKIPKAYNLTLINYQNLQTNGKQIDPLKVQRAVIVIHGLQRDPGTYMSNILSAIADVSDPNINPSSVAMMAPYFPNGDDKNLGYPYNSTNPTTGKPLVGSSQSYTGALVWTGSQWSGGGVNQYPAAYKTLSTYYVLDQLLQWFGNTTIFPNVKEIVVAGHSLGGQTVQRYVAAGLLPSQLGLTIPVTYWIANPNSYVWLNSSRPLSTASCSDYDQWRDGLQNFTGYISPATYNTAVMGTGAVGNVATIQGNYYAKNKAYARGLLDTGDDSSGCEPEVSGANRNERFFAFINWFPPTCKAPTSTTGHCDTVDFMQIGHDSGAMMASTAGQARLFTDNFYGNGSRAYDFGYPRVQAGDDPYPNPSLVSNTTANSTVYAGNMTLQGCYSDNTGSRTLSVQAYDNSSNTIELCTTTCHNAGYSIAGVEYGSQCYCANALFGGASYLVATACSEACAGNSSETCGDLGRINIYSNGAPTSYAAPGNPESVDNGNYFYQNCYSDTTSTRALSAKSYTDTANMTLDNCAAFCSGYEYFGIEYAEECYCGSCFNGGATILSQSKCEMTCTGNPSEYCGAGNALSVYQLSSSSNITVISQTCNTATTSATTATSTASSVPTASLCPAADGQKIIDANNNTYTVTCSSDSTQGSYTSASAVSSYLDCMTACDAQASTGCNGFTYVGGVNGSGSGTCWLKTAMGTYTSTGSNYIAAVYVSGRSTTTSTGATTGSTTSTSTTSSSTSSSAASLCPAANGQNIVDANNNTYTVSCSSDSTQGAYTSASAANTYLDCMTACDAQSSSNGCTGFTYVGAANGAGSGTCWLKTAMGTYTSTGSNFIAAVLVSTGSSSSSTVSSSSTATGSATSTSSASSATATSSTVSCPASDGTTYTTGGAQFLIECGIDHNGGDMGSTTANTFAACISACATTSGCVDVSYVGTSCYLKSTLLASSTSSSVFGAKLVSGGSSSSSSSSSASSSSGTVAASSTSSAATSTAVSCPASNGTTYTTGGAQFLIECGIDHNGGDMSSVIANTFAACISACATTSGCVDVSYLGTSCYLKSTLMTAGSSSSVYGAKLISSGVSSSSSSSSGTVASSSTSTVSVALNAVSTSSTASSSSSTAASSTTSAFPSATATTCPGMDKSSLVDSNGAVYNVYCSADTGSTTLNTVSTSTGILGCMNACDIQSGCTAFTYAASDSTMTGGFCYLRTVASRSSAGSTVAVAVQVSPPGSVVASSSSSSSSSVASSSSGTAASSSSAASTSVSSSSSTASSPLVSSSSSSSTIISSAKPSSTTSSSSTVQTSSSSTVSTFPSATATTCPGMDKSSLVDSNGSVYNVYCSADTGNSIITVTSTATGILGCMVSCDATTGCTSFTYAGDSTMTSGFCYLRTIGSRSSAGSTTAVAVLVSTGSGPSSSSSSSSVASSSSSSSVASSGSSSFVSSSSSSSSVSSSSSSSSITSSGTSAAAAKVNVVAQSTNTASSSTSSSSSVSSSTVPISSTSSFSASSSSSSSLSSSSVASSTTSSSSTVSSTPSPSATSASTSSTSYSTSSSSSSTASVTPFAPAIIGNYTWLGCYNDTSPAGALQQDGFNSSTSNPMTLEKCASYCASYTYWGVENGQQCFCGNVLSNASYNTTASSCSTVCSGNSTELCGASGKLEIYSLISSSTTSGVSQATGTSQRRRRVIKGMRGA